MDEILRLIEAILNTAKNHPLFNEECFEKKDIKTLCEIGGDECDWTMIAIQADEACKRLEKIMGLKK
jgi:hypothetical protein